MKLVRASFRHRTVTLGLAICILATTGSVGAADRDDQWHFRLTPYLWFPAISGSIDTLVTGLAGPRAGEPRWLDVSTTVNPSSYLSNLNMAAMLSAEASKGRWSILTDIVYTDFGNQETRVRRAIDPFGRRPNLLSRKASTDISATVWTLAGGYRLVDDADWSVDLIAGARYLSLSSDLKLTLIGPRGRYLRGHKVSTDSSNWDGIVGLRGRAALGNTRWFVPFYADVGTGESDLTWQAMLGVGYRFDWGEMALAWRALNYRFDGGDVDLTMNGPGLSVGFRW